MKIVVTSNTTKIAARYRRMARAMPGLMQQAIGALVEKEALPLFQNTTKTWKHTPTFNPLATARGWTVVTDDDIWRWIDRGVPGRVITPKKKPYLVFNWPYTAATKPRWISSRQAKQGDNLARKLSVNWPGIRARNFTDTIMKRMQARAAGAVRDYLNQASYGAGTGL